MVEDADKALTYDDREMRRCKGCNTFRDEWPADPRDEPPYEAGARTCPGCAELQRRRDALPKDARGMYVFLTPFSDDIDPDTGKRYDEMTEEEQEVRDARSYD